MKVAILSETYPRRMGYLVTMLPRYLARQGAEVHLITMDLPPYHYMSGARSSASAFFDGQIPSPGSSFGTEGYQVHVLGHRRRFGYVAFDGLHALLRQIGPDVVYSCVAIGWIPLQAWASSLRLDFKLFTGSHTSRASFPLATFRWPWLSFQGWRCLVQRWVPGRIVSLKSQLCYAPTMDCGEIAVRFFGVQARKVRVVHLGVDFDVFHPVTDTSEELDRESLRRDLGFASGEIVCVYSGKVEEYKRVDFLAEAVRLLRARGIPFKLLVVGGGSALDAVRVRDPDARIVDFVPYQELGRYYRAADVAAWPFGESTSMLDAAACGLPIVVSDSIYQEHVTGNGLSCAMRSADELADRLAELADPALRRKLGAAGVAKMREGFDWNQIAARRMGDFQTALQERTAVP